MNNPTITRIYSRPVVGIVFSLWTYLCTLFVATQAPRALPPGGIRDFVVLTVPLLALLLVVGILYFVYRASDEYIRHRILKSAALTGVILAFSITGYFCLERLGFPQPSMLVLILYACSVSTFLLLWAFCRA
jgi:hypothetical protein